MTKETMNVHEALSTLKMLDKRIADMIKETTWVVANKHSNSKIGGVPVGDWCEDVKSKYQKLNDLIRRRDAIKRAVVKSNAVAKVTVCGVEYTVAEAIDRKNHGIVTLSALHRSLSVDYKDAKVNCDIANGDRLESRADDHVRNIVGSADMKGATEEAQRVRKEFIESQTMEVVDPIGIVAEIARIEDEMLEFEANVDAALSVSNATTMIEVAY